MAAAKLCVNSWCRLAFPSNARLMGKSKSGKLASNISSPTRGTYWRHCAVSRICSCFAKTRKVQNPAKLCAIGEAIGQNVNGLTRAYQTAWLVLCTSDLGRHRQKSVVNALDLRTNLPPLEVDKDGCARVGA